MTDTRLIELGAKNCSCFHLFERSSGLLGTSPIVVFSHSAFGCQFEISIAQKGAREIIISSDKCTKAIHFWTIFQNIEKMNMLFEGYFLHLECGDFYLDNTKTDWSDELFNELKQRKLSLYYSAAFTVGCNSFLNPLQKCSESMFSNWVLLESELDIVHSMVLYALSDIKIPVDLKCAMIVESFESMYELIKKNNPTLSIVPARIKNGEKDSKLRRILKTLIIAYGNDIFAQEANKDLDDFCQVLVNTRNRMAHIKTNCSKLYLSAEEAVLYNAKLSVLYRHILLQLLGVNYADYSNRLKEIVQAWDSWNGTLSFFLNTQWS